MSICVWDESLAIGHKKIDEQHKRLITLIADLHSAMSLGVTHSDYKPIRMRLYEYSVFHFTEEEKLMEHANYKFRAEHEREHSKFINELDLLAEKSMAQSADIGTETFSLLVNWFLNHISVTDKKLVECLRNNNSTPVDFN
jgi:hemerythrin